MNSQTILIMDFGGQYKELIARRVRECGVYSIIRSHTVSAADIKALAPIGIIFTGGPNSVYSPDSPTCDPEIFELGIPILGICYGMQLITHMLGGRVESCDKSEFGIVDANIFNTRNKLFRGMGGSQRVLMSHSDRVVEPPRGFCVLASTHYCHNAAIADADRKIYGVQFHPEVENTTNGLAILRNFIISICGADGKYDVNDYIEQQIAQVRATVGDERVLLGLSGGVDSAVCAAILAKALPGKLTCIFVDHGFMRKNEGDEIAKAFSDRDLNLIRVNAADKFFAALKGVREPEEKRKIIGKKFVEVFEEESAKLGDIRFLAQGTIYPDVVESGANASAKIKSHHNVGGLPEDMVFSSVIEPLKGLFKDEVRKVGELLGLPEKIVRRQPFPGPGLAIRIIGEVTPEKVAMLQEADHIFRDEIERSDHSPDQFFAVLTSDRTVGVMGDYRTYEYTLALRAVRTNDFMTCEFMELPIGFLGKVSARITNEVHGINRVVYDITSKPPATIEWE